MRGGKREGSGAKKGPEGAVITIRTFPKTKKAIKETAAALGLSLSEYMIRASIEKGFDNQA